jgi:hypothetical protein
LDFTSNILNKKAEAFYRRHGVETFEPAAESGRNETAPAVMRTKHCLRRELDLCKRSDGKTIANPMILQDEEGREYEVRFLCGQCVMEIFLGYEED